MYKVINLIIIMYISLRIGFTWSKLFLKKIINEYIIIISYDSIFVSYDSILIEVNYVNSIFSNVYIIIFKSVV